MSKVMLINVVNAEESRIAIVADGLLEEVAIETAQHEQIEGNIYKARIVKVIPSLDAVFVDYGGERNGFLPVDDIHPSYFPSGRRDTAALRTGQNVMVQVRKGEVGQKGAALTTYISLPGRYFVLMPFVAKRGVSRKIEDDAARRQLREVLDSAQIPEEMGYIVRTAAQGRTKQELTRDVGYLLRLWKRIRKEYDNAPSPCLLYQESDLVIRTIRDYFTPAIQEVWVDDEEAYEQVRKFFQAVMPWYTRRVKLHQRHTPLFARYNVEDQLATIYEKAVPLPSGGSIVIEQTEALVSIDVNSGGAFQGKDIEETALRVNREAALEAARQLRLRDLGGLIVIDFIDMRSSANRSTVRKTLQKILKEDKARTEVGTISKFGLLELSRQRLKPAASISVTLACPTCGGSGRVRSPESFALTVLRMIQAELPRKELTRVRVGVPPDVATLLLNRKRRQILELERTFDASVLVFPEPQLQPNQYYIEYEDENGGCRSDTNVPEGFPKDLLATAKGLPEPPPRAQRSAAYILIEDEPEEDEEKPVEEAASNNEEEAGGAKKRRRRRKRRKKRPAEPAEAPEAAEPDEPQAPAAEAEGSGEEAQAEGTKRRKRRRSRKKKAPAQEAAPQAPAEGEAPAQIPPQEAPEAQPAPEAAEGATEPERARSSTRKRRRRSRKKKAPAQEAPSQAPAEGEAPAETPPLEAPEPPAGPAPEAPAPGPTPEPEPREAAQAPAPQEAPPEEKPAPKKRTRARRKKAEPDKAPEPAPETPAPEPAPETPPQEAARAPAPQEAPPEEKPAPKKRTRARRKKAEPDKAPEPAPETPAPEPAPETPPQEAAQAPAPQEAPPEEKPAPKKRTRARRKKAEPDKAPEPAPEAPAPGAARAGASQESAPEEKPAPKRRTPKKKAEAAPPAEGAEAVGAGTPAEPGTEAGAKRPARRRPRKNAAEPGPGEGAGAS